MNIGRSVKFLPLFVAASFLYFYDVFTGGLILALDDGLHYFYPMLSIAAGEYKEWTLPLWNSYEFSGFPLMAASQAGVFYPSMVLYIIFPAHIAYNLDIVLHIALAGFFTFIYVRKIGVETFPALVAGFVFSFLGYLIPHIVHLSILKTASWLPLILYCFETIRQTGEVRCAFIASLPVAIQMLAGHPQIYAYSLMVILLYIAYHAVFSAHGSRVRFLALTASSLALGMLVASPQLIATRELYSLGLRPALKYETFADFSLPLKGLISLFFPLASNTKDGYVGVLTLVFAIAAAIKERKNHHVRFWGIVAAGALLLSLGDSLRPLHKIMFHVPFYNKFRGVEKHLMMYGLAVSVLAALGISYASRNWKSYLPLLATLLLLVLAAAVPISSVTGIITAPVLYIPLIALASYTALLFLVEGTKKRWLLKFLLILALLFDVISLRSSGWPEANVLKNYGKGIFDVLDSRKGRTAFFIRPIGALLATSRGISIVDGYDPFIMAEYAMLLDMRYLGSLSHEKKGLLINNSLLSMLNTRYIFLLPEEASFVNGLPFYRKILETPVILLYENLNGLPRAYHVAELETAENIGEVKNKIYGRDIDIAMEALVSDIDLKAIGTNEFYPGTVEITSYEHTEVTLETKFPQGRGFVVLADQYYPGWFAYIDGIPTNIYKTNGVVRGVVVPAGTHKVLFRYRPIKIYAFMALSIFTLAGIATALIRLKR